MTSQGFRGWFWDLGGGMGIRGWFWGPKCRGLGAGIRFRVGFSDPRKV